MNFCEYAIPGQDGADSLCWNQDVFRVGNQNVCAEHIALTQDSEVNPWPEGRSEERAERMDYLYCKHHRRVFHVTRRGRRHIHCPADAKGQFREIGDESFINLFYEPGLILLWWKTRIEEWKAKRGLSA